MRKFFYARLALTNLKNNVMTYLPYILTCTGTIIMFYNICALTFHPSIQGSVADMMALGVRVIAIFAVVFLFYTNSFLIKRRKKEFGLFNILGMEKRHIGKIMAWESLFTSLFALVNGVLLGILFNKLFILLLYKIINFNPDLAFAVSPKAVLYTAVLFAALFLVMLLNNLRHVHTANPIALLQGGNVGEREPKTKWLIALAGAAALGTGYYLALTIETPMAALNIFFIAVICVIIGTYFLFTAGSIALLKILKRNKSYFYQTRHFTTVSGMIYRMKQNAAGLAGICVMSTIVIVMISTTISMYAGMENLLSNRFSKEFSLSTQDTAADSAHSEQFFSTIDTFLAQYPDQITDDNAFRYLSFTVIQRDGEFAAAGNNTMPTTDHSALSLLYIVTAADYANITGKQLELRANEAAIYDKDAAVAGSVRVLNQRYQIKMLLSEPLSLNQTASLKNSGIYLVVPGKSDLNRLYQEQAAVYGKEASKISSIVCFNLAMPQAEKASFCQSVLVDDLYQKVLDQGADEETTFESRELSKANFYELYGSLLFLGIFLGTLFLMATVLMIYYKQVVEGFDDKNRFHIMKKVGMSKEEIKKSVHSQVLTVFALPLIVAAIHVAVAFPLLTKMLALLNLTDVPLFMQCTAATILVFAIIYGLVYALTARTYYKIVNGETK